MNGSRTADGLAHTEREIRAEQATALARIAETLEGLLCESERRRLAFGSLDGGERRSARAEYEALRRRVVLYRWYLEVQREAVGLWRHDDLDRFYPLPPPLG